MSNGGGDGGGNERVGVFARGIPSVRTTVVEAKENRQIVEQTVIAFVASFVLLFLGWVLLNTAAYELTWLWDFVVRASMIVPAYLVALWITRAMTADTMYKSVVRTTGLSPRFEIKELDAYEQAQFIRSVQRWATVAGFLVWWFLAGDTILGIPLPIGDVGRYLVRSFDLPEGAALGVFMLAMWRSVAAMFFVSGFLSLIPLTGRMRAEINDRYHAPVEVAIREVEWRIEQERAKFNIGLAEQYGLEIGEEGVVIQPTKYSGPRLESSSVPAKKRPALPPARKVLIDEQPVMGVRGYSKRVKKDVDVSPESARYFILEIESGRRNTTRASWSGDEVISMTEWDAMIDVLNKAGAVDRQNKNLLIPADVLLKKLRLPPADDDAPLPEEMEDQE